MIRMQRAYYLFAASLLLFSFGCPQMTDMGNGNDNQNENTNDNGDGMGQERAFQAALDGAQEVPALDVEATATGMFTLNAEMTELTFDISYSGLTGPAMLAHFHNAPTGVNGGVVFDMSDLFTANPGNEGMVQGTWMLTEDDVTALLADELYVNIHTAQHPGGEIRGQVLEAQQP